MNDPVGTACGVFRFIRALETPEGEMSTFEDARTPPGLRIYAIGDIHGCRHELLEVHDRIRGDLRDRPCADWRIVHLGDYVDRGPDIKGVVSELIRLVQDRKTYALLGNHDQWFMDFLVDPATDGFLSWTTYGGAETIQAYGGSLDAGFTDDLTGRHALRETLLQSVPEEHLRFLSTLPHSLRFGSYFFVHAGVRPGVPLDRQSIHDLIWIREPFLSSSDDLGAVIVHGHTVVLNVVARSNRIGIDTGAVHGGTLSCLVLEDDEKMLLNADGPERLELTA